MKNIDFSGSYLKSDVIFLLKVIEIETSNIERKESEIQSGRKHYSEMISPEYRPSKEYLDIFYKSLEQNMDQFAQDILNFAFNIPKNSVLVSLARAGTPIGVLLKRIIKDRRKLDIPHFSISIIRDRGVDMNALKYIQEKYPTKDIFFIDGWTGKGVIGKELKKSVEEYNLEYGTDILPHLSVLSDISGKAEYSVSKQDYMIPSSALNSTISGLVSRTVLNIKYIGKDDFHGCKFYSEFRDYDLSLWFVDKVVERTKKLKPDKSGFLKRDLEKEKICEEYIDQLMKKWSISNINFIKPGIAETTRVLLRRVPERVILKDIQSDDVKHLIQLAKEKNVTINELKNLPYSAVGIIKNVNKEKNNGKII